jgi:hypothetical protein
MVREESPVTRGSSSPNRLPAHTRRFQVGGIGGSGAKRLGGVAARVAGRAPKVFGALYPPLQGLSGPFTGGSVVLEAVPAQPERRLLDHSQ